MVQKSVHDHTRAQGKRKEIGHRERSGQIEGRVLVVSSHIEGVLWGEHPRDVVHVTKAVIGLRAEHWEVRKIPRLAEREAKEDEGDKEDSHLCNTV